VWVTAVPAGHGDLAPDAAGVVVELGGARVYHAGDTAYRADSLPALRELQPYGEPGVRSKEGGRA
jgi:L-ascorbate metabolism protein UlaG (beta-lactamase superfamily)